MTFDELLTEAKIAERRQRDLALMRAGGDVRQALRTHHGGTRRAVAARLIRIGAWLDGDAAERFVIARRTR